MVIIFPLREKLHILFMQQRPRYTGGRRVITLPVMPWDDADRPPVINFGIVDKPPTVAANIPYGFGLCATRIINIPLSYFKQPIYLSSFSEQRFEPAVVHAIKPLPATLFNISGVSKDNSGAVLPNCSMSLFRVDYDSGFNKVYIWQGNTISDASGNYYFNVNNVSNYMVIAYNSSGTVAGITLNILTGINS